MGSHQSRVERQNPLPRHAGHTCFDAVQDMVGLLGCRCTLVAHVQFFIHQYPQVLLGRAAPNPFIPKPVLLVGVLFYSILFYSILFYSILFYSILFYSILFYSIAINSCRYTHTYTHIHTWISLVGTGIQSLKGGDFPYEGTKQILLFSEQTHHFCSQQKEN